MVAPTPQSPAPVAASEAELRAIRAMSDNAAFSINQAGVTLDNAEAARVFDDITHAVDRILSRPASDQPVEAIGAGREEIARVIRDRAQIGGTDWRRNAHGADINAEELADLIAALSPASPARSPMGGDVALVPRKAVRSMTMAGCGCLPAVDGVFGIAGKLCSNVWDAMVEEGEKLLAAAPTPMGGELEALVADIDAEMEGRERGYADRRGELLFRCRDALAASSPSPAQGGSVADLCMSNERAKETAKPMHVDDATGWVIRVANGNVRFWSRDRVLVEQKASEWGLVAVPEPLGPRPFVPPAGEIEDALSEVSDRIPDTILHGNSFGHQGFYPHAAIKTLVAALYAAAPPSVQPVEGK